MIDLDTRRKFLADRKSEIKADWEPAKRTLYDPLYCLTDAKHYDGCEILYQVVDQLYAGSSDPVRDEALEMVKDWVYGGYHE